jgi:hypothetical protein
MNRDDLLAVGLVLAMETQIRIGGLPFGLGELCLALWLILVVGSEANALAKPTFAFWVMTTFWAFFVAAQSFGTVWGIVIGVEYDRELFLHDVIAYALLAPLSCLMVLKADAAMHLRRTACTIVIIGSTSLAVQFVQGQGLISIPGLNPWFWERFRGWSANPNQLGLFCTVLGLLALHLADTATSRKARLAAVACLVLPVIVGRMTWSDTFTLTFLTSAPIFLVMKLWSATGYPGGSRPSRMMPIQLALVAAPVLMVAMMPLAMSLTDDNWQLPVSLAKENGKEAAQETDLRLSLWYQALQLTAETGMIGLGPGPHLKIPDSIVSAHASATAEPDNVAHPTQGAAPNFEAHNMLLDIFTQGGAIAALSVIWLHSKAFVTIYRARLAGLMTLLAGICVFGLTSFIIRHPMYWFVLTLCLVGQPGNGRAEAEGI